MKILKILIAVIVGMNGALPAFAGSCEDWINAKGNSLDRLHYCRDRLELYRKYGPGADRTSIRVQKKFLENAACLATVKDADQAVAKSRSQSGRSPSEVAACTSLAAK